MVLVFRLLNLLTATYIATAKKVKNKNKKYGANDRNLQNAKR